MPCNCGKAKKEFIYTNTKGEQQVHETLVSAKAAKIREQKAVGRSGSVQERVKS